MMIEICGLSVRDTSELRAHKTPDDPSVSVHMRLPVSAWRRLQDVADDAGTTASEIMRVLMMDFLKKFEKSS